MYRSYRQGPYRQKKKKKRTSGRRLRLAMVAAAVILLAALLGLAAWLTAGWSRVGNPAGPECEETAGNGNVFRTEDAAGVEEAAEAKDLAGVKEAAEAKDAEAAGYRYTTAAAEEQQAAETESAPGNSSAEDGQTVLLFAGDVYLSDYVLNAYDAAGGIAGVLDEGIRGEIAGADIFMVNQEFPFTDRGQKAADKQFTFRLPPSRVNILREMGVNVVTMANNHILDFGPEGITDSLSALDEAGIRHVGAGENLEQASRLEVIEAGGIKVGFLGVSRVYMDAGWAAGTSHPGVFSTYDPSAALEAIRKAKSQCDYLVIYVHWGVEKETEPQEYQRTMGRQYLDAGADLVVGSHPHVLQEIEDYNGKPIVHSLGNFVFGSSIPETELLKVIIEDGRAEVSVIPCRSSNGYTRLR